MSVDFKTSITKDNLMRAFAGESQARNRYTMAASQAKKEGLPVIEAVFTFTADQEKEHAQIFYEHLRACWGNHHSGRGYPVDISQSVAQLFCAMRSTMSTRSTMMFTSPLEKRLWRKVSPKLRPHLI